MPGSLLKGIFDELRLQAHLGAMELQQQARPYLDRADAATRDFLERRRQQHEKTKR